MSINQALGQLVARHFNLDEVALLSAELSVPFHDLPGTTATEKAQELVGYLDRSRGQSGLEELAEAIVKNRPILGDEIDRLLHRPVIAVDLSHKQKEWRGYLNFMDKLPGWNFQLIEQGILEQWEEIESAAALVMALPYRCEYGSEEINQIAQWVSGGGRLFLLGYYFADMHHGSDPSSLARLLGAEFSNNLVGPGTLKDETEIHSYGASQTFSARPELAVKYQVPAEEVHPLARGVKELGFLSPCTLENIVEEREYSITIPNTVLIKAEGPKTAEGYVLQIRRRFEDKRGPAEVFAAWKLFEGRVVACGTWKLLTVDYGDNLTLANNALRWLTR